MIKTTLTIMLITNICLTSNLSFFVEREATIGGSDYVNIFVEDGNRENQKIVYKLPQSFRNKEVFRLKICKKGTIANANGKTGKELDELVSANCLTDTYNTRSIIDYDEKLMLEELQIYNLYKICIFGFTFPEIEKSFMSVPFSRFNRLVVHDQISDVDDSLYFLDSAKISELIQEDSNKDKNYRDDFNSSVENRCHLEFSQDLVFETSNFQNESLFLSSQTHKSFLLVEYEFQVEPSTEVPTMEEFKTAEISAEKKIKGRANIIKSLEKDYIIKSEKTEKTKITFEVFGNGDEEKEVDEFIVNSDNENKQGSGVQIQITMGEKNNPKNQFTGFYKLPVKNDRFVRFFPMVCYRRLKEKYDYSYEFIGDHSCVPLSHDKIILFKQNGGFKFFKHDKTPSQTTEHDFDEMNMELVLKDNVNKTIMVQGFEDQCDGVYDKFAALFYLVCYQKTLVNKKLSMFRILGGKKTTSINFELEENSTVRTNIKAKRHTNDKAGKIAVGASIALFALSMIVLIFISAAFGWILFVIFLLVAVFTFFFMKSNRGKNIWMLFKPAEVDKVRRLIMNRSYYVDMNFKVEKADKMVVIDSSKSNVLGEEELSQFRPDLEATYFKKEEKEAKKAPVENRNTPVIHNEPVVQKQDVNKVIQKKDDVSSEEDDINESKKNTIVTESQKNFVIRI